MRAPRTETLGWPAATAPRAPRVLRAWAEHALCFAVPLLSLAFLATGPHRWYAALPWLGVVAAVVVLDNLSGPDLRAPERDLPAWPFDLALYALVALQGLNVLLLARMIAAGGALSADGVVAVVLVGGNSGYSAIVVAHELIHRRERHMQWLGRALLCTVMYEHFYTEHVRGHHARVGTDEDPATARFGEGFRAFWARTVPAQFRSAWRLEAQRLGDPEMGVWDVRTFRNRVAQGVAAEVALAAALGAVFGPGALAVYLLQALFAVRLLEVVNYFEHWGLRREGRRVRPVDSWDADSWFTRHALVGLSRHADHHAYASRAYPQLRRWEESPKLPRGYMGMVVMVLLNEPRCRELMTAELSRRRLGPFAPQAVPEE